MSLDWIDIMTIVATFIALYCIWDVVRTVNKQKKSQKQQRDDASCIQTEYDDILAITSAMENDRQKNCGQHFDEDVYLNRAHDILQRTRFFDWVNHGKRG